ncbi:MAG: HAD family hydrolase [Treponemataceae bacterium]|nr:HAD family hydrolase [Treponemataceae bacterium]
MYVFFDLDRTLMDFEIAEDTGIKKVFDTYRSQIFMDFQEFRATWKKWAQIFFDQYSEGKLTFDQQRQARVAKSFELNNSILDADQVRERFNLYWDAYEEAYDLFADSMPLLNRLKDAGIPLGLITNGDSANQHKKLAKTKLDQVFDPILISAEVGISKPEPGIFDKARELSGNLSQCQLWYIGDSPVHDIEPARKLGWNVIYLNRTRTAPQPEVVRENNVIYAEVQNLEQAGNIILN